MTLVERVERLGRRHYPRSRFVNGVLAVLLMMAAGVDRDQRVKRAIFVAVWRGLRRFWGWAFVRSR